MPEFSRSEWNPNPNPTFHDWCMGHRALPRRAVMAWNYLCPLVIKGSKVLQEHATQTKLPVEPNASDLDEHFFKNFSTLVRRLLSHDLPFCPTLGISRPDRNARGSRELQSAQALGVQDSKHFRSRGCISRLREARRAGGFLLRSLGGR